MKKCSVFMFLVFTVIFINSSLLLGGEINADDKTVLLAAEDGWPPFSGPNAEGLAEDIIKAAYKAVGYNVKYISVPFARAEYMALKGKTVDGFFTTLKSPEYEKKTIFPKNPIAMNEDSFFALKEKKLIYKDLNSIKGLKVGTVNEYPYSEAFEKADFFKKDPAPSSASNLKKLIKKRIDVLIEDKIVLFQMLKEKKLQDKVELIGIQAINPLYICFSINRPIIKTFVSKFDEGMEIIKANGTYKEIMAKYQ